VFTDFIVVGVVSEKMPKKLLSVKIIQHMLVYIDHHFMMSWKNCLAPPFTVVGILPD